MCGDEVCAYFDRRHGKESREQVLEMVDQVLCTGGRAALRRVFFLADLFGNKLVKGAREPFGHFQVAVENGTSATMVTSWRPGLRPAEAMRIATLAAGEVDVDSVRIGQVVRAISTPVETTQEKLPPGA